jgi:phosphatidylglycerol---prolipoprotein diacylglyceryl transferase
MAAVLPYFTIPPLDLGFVEIQPFGIMVAAGVLLGAHLCRRYADKQGLDPDAVQSLIAWTVITGFIISHVFDVFAYQPEKLLTDPLLLFKVWAGISSVGGQMGAVIGFLLYFRFHRDKGYSKLQFADAIAMGTVPGFVLGRAGCAIVHDHPGLPSDFFLAFQFPDGVARHDLGFYEMLWLIVMTAIIYTVAAVYKARPRGLLIALMALLYGPVRFLLDFLRAAPAEGGDPRYLGLTPGHYVSVGISAVGVFILWYVYAHRNDPLPTPAVVAKPDEEGRDRPRPRGKGKQAKNKRSR